MIFDDPRVKKIRKKYESRPMYEWPEILRLATHAEFENERIVLENIMSSVSEECKNKWFNQFLSPRPDQYWGVWFELMLYEWLQNHFKDNVKRNIEEHTPDFELSTDETKIQIEATAHVIPPDERARERNHLRIFDCLREIKKPYGLFIDVEQIGTTIDENALMEKVEKWIMEPGEFDLLYTDDFGNRLVFKDKKRLNFDHVAPCSMKPFTYDQEALKKGLKRKALQHKKNLNPDSPYVIAIFLEAVALSGNDVKEEIFGKTQVVIDWNSNKVIKTRTDESGILYDRGKIKNKHISGFLAFRASIDETLKRRVFKSWYIENPYASVPIRTNLFPVDSKYIVIEKKPNIFWIGFHKISATRRVGFRGFSTPMNYSEKPYQI